MRAIRIALPISLAILLAATLLATKVKPMNLQELCQKSARVFNGTLMEVSQISVQAGGGELPAVLYTFRVNEAFKGEFETIKGVPVAHVRMVGTVKQAASQRPVIPGFPTLSAGQTYLLMVAPEGPTGLTTTMGLGQGCFNVAGKAGQLTVQNSFDNRGLFQGMSVSGMPDSGPIPYPAFINLIQQIIEEY